MVCECKVRFNIVLGILLALLAVACSSSDDEELIEDARQEITVVFSPNGLGDQGYNDLILRGVQQFAVHNSDVSMQFCMPVDLAGGEQRVREWLDAAVNEEGKRLLVLASNDYSDICREILKDVRIDTLNNVVILFENEGLQDLPVHTFDLSMYGASFLAGVALGEFLRDIYESNDAEFSPAEIPVLIMEAYEGAGQIGAAADGFIDGYKEAEGVAPQVSFAYLAEDWSGYSMADNVYAQLSEWHNQYEFIYPLAGGSNEGVYRFLREYNWSFISAGMDVDKQNEGDVILGSLLKHIDNIVFDLLNLLC